jgi:SAM-dependent methyltransferase
MQQDATDQQIKAILDHVDLEGKTVLEIGCGSGRITRDLAEHAAMVIACDPDCTALEKARNKLSAPNVRLLHAPQGIPDIAKQSVDLVLYTLSLHHVPIAEMQSSLLLAGQLLKPDGSILVLEPGDGGSFNEAKARFGAGSGDEGPLKNAALQAMQSLPGWKMSARYHFMTEFLFADEDDFFRHKLPAYEQLPEKARQEIQAFLRPHRSARGLSLSSERYIILLRPTE